MLAIAPDAEARGKYYESIQAQGLSAFPLSVFNSPGTKEGFVACRLDLEMKARETRVNLV